MGAVYVQVGIFTDAGLIQPNQIIFFTINVISNQPIRPSGLIGHLAARTNTGAGLQVLGLDFIQVAEILVGLGKSGLEHAPVIGRCPGEPFTGLIFQLVGASQEQQFKKGHKRFCVVVLVQRISDFVMVEQLASI